MIELKEIISKEAVEYLQEVDTFGGEISMGCMRHDYLTNLNQTFNKETGYWSDTPSPYKKGADECWEKKLIENCGGYEGSYIRYRITNKGKEVLEIAAKL